MACFLLWLTGCGGHRLFRKRENYQHRVLCKATGATGKDVNKEWFLLSKEKRTFPSWNALAQTSLIALAKLHDLHYELLSYVSYSLDLANSDLFFSESEELLAGRKLISYMFFIVETNAYYSKLEKLNYT